LSSPHNACALFLVHSLLALLFRFEYARGIHTHPHHPPPYPHACLHLSLVMVRVIGIRSAS
jgi:hypothetical protein